MKKINKSYLPIFLLITSCASNSPIGNRDVASVESCLELAGKILNTKVIPEGVVNKLVEVSDDAIVERHLLDKLTDEFGLLSEQPQELLEAYGAFYSGRMSLTVFRKISSEYPNLKGHVSLLIFKDVLKSLHLDDQLSPNGKEIIEKTFSKFGKKFQYRAETVDYYVLDFPVSDASDAVFLGKLGTISVIHPLIYAKDASVPTNNFFKLPQATIREFNKRIKDKVKRDSDVRYGLLRQLENQRMTYDAFKALAFDFDGKSPKSIVFSVYKTTLKEQRELNPELYTGIPHKDVEDGLGDIDFAGKFERLPDTADSLAYKITFKSLDELKMIEDLFSLSFFGRISLLE